MEQTLAIPTKKNEKRLNNVTKFGNSHKEQRKEGVNVTTFGNNHKKHEKKRLNVTCHLQHCQRTFEAADGVIGSTALLSHQG
jgi:hypothetical protein